jgi:hypothetical protein
LRHLRLSREYEECHFLADSRLTGTLHQQCFLCPGNGNSAPEIGRSELPLPGPEPCIWGQVKSWNSGELDPRARAVGMSVFQISSFSVFRPELGALKSCPDTAHPASPLPTPGGCMQSPHPAAHCDPLSDAPGTGMPLPSGGSPPHTRPLWCQFSTISVNTKTQLVEPIRKDKYKCANSGVE